MSKLTLRYSPIPPEIHGESSVGAWTLGYSHHGPPAPKWLQGMPRPKRAGICSRIRFNMIIFIYIYALIKVTQSFQTC